MNLVDSSGWLEYLADAQNAPFFAPPIFDLQNLLVPTICMAEVFKWILRERGEESALEASATMREGIVVDLDASIAIFAAKIGHELKLPMADSIILATSRHHDAILWTQDADFENLQGVRFIKK